MIKLDVAEYCHDCPDFEPEAIKPDPIYDGDGNYCGMLGNVFVDCKHRKICRRFMTYLKRHLAKEKGENIL